MKKTLLSGILASSLILSLGVYAPVVEAVTVEETPIMSQTLASPESDFTFLNGTITKYNGSDSVVVVPSTINGQAVTKIGDSAFSNKSRLC